MTAERLTPAQVERFIEDGFVHLQGVVPAEVVEAGREVIWSDLGRSPDDPSSWSEPVTRVVPSDGRPFRIAFENPRLYSAFDQIVGAGRWLPRRNLGLFVVRFPHHDDPVDTGWHIDSSFGRCRWHAWSAGVHSRRLRIGGTADRPCHRRRRRRLPLPSLLGPRCAVHPRIGSPLHGPAPPGQQGAIHRQSAGRRLLTAGEQHQAWSCQRTRRF